MNIQVECVIGGKRELINLDSDLADDVDSAVVVSHALFWEQGFPSDMKYKLVDLSTEETIYSSPGFVEDFDF